MQFELAALAWLLALSVIRFCVEVTTTWKAIPSAVQRRHLDAVAIAMLLTLSVAADDCWSWYFSTKSVRPSFCSDAFAWLVMVWVAGGADVFTAAMAGTAGAARVASAVSAATPERGRNLKALILDRIFILSLLARVNISHMARSQLPVSGDFPI